MKSIWLFIVFVFCYAFSFGQAYLVRDQSINVSKNGISLSYAWAGGLNNPQFSQTDFNSDGVQDIFVFDKSGNVILPFVQAGSNGIMNLVYQPLYIRFFPRLYNWALLRDFNCDGFQDIYSYSEFGPGVMVYENNGQIGSDWFTIADSLLYTYYEIGSSSGDVNIFVGTIDIPAIYDYDEDGDLDIFTFQLQGSKVEYHKNYSIENDQECGLAYEMKNRCWGYFAEDDNSEEILLGQSCVNVVDPEFGGQMHSGSTLLMLDINNDGFKEIVLGDFNYNGLTTVVNGGPGEMGPDSITSVNYNFPNEDTPLFINNFPASFYVDVNNDGVNDFIAAPNAQYTADNLDAVHLFLNNGENDNPDLAAVEGSFLQDKMVDIGEGAHPSIVDIDQDGLVDLLIANRKSIVDSVSSSAITYYKNTGSVDQPSFIYVENDYADLSTSGVGEAIYPTFMDLNGDGALDLIIGNLDGELFYFINQANENEEFDFSGGANLLVDNTDTHIDVGQFAKPQAFDIDQDGLKDLLIGKRVGTISYYRNTGSSNNPEFTLINETLGDVVAPGFLANTGYSAPHFFMEDGEVKLILGSEVGEFDYYEEISDNLDGSFDPYFGPASNFFEGKRVSAYRYDLNNDNLPDLLVGNYRGGISFFRGDLSDEIFETENSNNETLLYPNPASDIVHLSFRDEEMREIRVYNSLGQLTFELINNQKELEFSVNDWDEGHYFISIINDKTSYYKPLMVIH